MKYPLNTRRKPTLSGIMIFKSSLPFVNNSIGKLIHRPIEITVHKLPMHSPHLAVHYYCNSQSCGGMDKYEFLDVPPDDKLVCARCEEAAIAAGLPSSDEIAGKHVHKGRVYAKQTCCQKEPQ